MIFDPNYLLTLTTAKKMKKVFCLSSDLGQSNDPDHLCPNLDPGSPTQPDSTRIWTLGALLKIGFKSGSYGFIMKYIIGLKPNLNPIWGQLDPFFDL